MSDLIVRTRVDVAKRNLARIADLAAMMVRSEKTIKEFIDLPAESQATVTNLQLQVLKLKGLALPYRDDAPDLWADLNALEQQLDDESTHLKGVARRAKELKTRFVVSPEARKDVATHLVKGSVEVASQLSVKTYLDPNLKLRERCELIFNEYVDLLRGIALRNAGFGDADWEITDLFDIADQLPGLWPDVNGWVWQSIAIPSRAERRASSEAMVLRIGFPEWTIWALPLIHHEFGYVFVKRMGLLADRPSREISCLADALAILVTGPAYACAELLLRLPLGPSLAATDGDLQAADPEGLEVAMRSATILAVLKSEARNDPSLDKLAKSLDTEWRAAVKAAAGSPSLFDQVTKDRAWKNAVDEIVRVAREAVLPPDPNGGRSAPPWATDWVRIVTLADELKKPSPTVDLSHHAAVANILNAIWLARVTADPARGEDAAQVEHAAQVAVRLLTGDRGPEPTSPASTTTTSGRAPAQTPRPANE